MKIPDELWRCPKCGAGWNGVHGLCYEAQAGNYDVEDSEYDPDGDCRCYTCGWTGYAQQIYDAAIMRSRRKPCPHCGGTGWTEGGEPDIRYDV